MEISKKNPKWVESKRNMEIILELTETNLFSIKMDYLFTV